jgi:hypothetical protein
LARRFARTTAQPIPATILSGRLPEEAVKEFARHTPPEVANWLRRQLAAIPGHPVLRVLAVDDRMSDLWTMLESWAPKVWLVHLAVHFSAPTILSALERPSEDRDSLAWAEFELGVAARDFATLLEFWGDTAAEFWGEPIGELLQRLNSVADRAFERGAAKQSVYNDIPEPDPRGPGIRKQLAFREAMSRRLERICEKHRLSKQKQDVVIATITSVVFPAWDVDVDTIERHRKRRRKRALSEQSKSIGGDKLPS